MSDPIVERTRAAVQYGAIRYQEGLKRALCHLATIEMEAHEYDTRDALGAVAELVRADLQRVGEEAPK